MENLNNEQYLRFQYYLENGVDLNKLSIGLGLPVEDTVKFITEEYFFERYRNLFSENQNNFVSLSNN